MLKRQINISESEILTRYNKLDAKIKEIINSLYKLEKDKVIACSWFSINFIQINKEFLNMKKCSALSDFKDKIGVYIFLDTLNIPVYIGFSGKGKTNSLKTRLSFQLKGNPINSNLVKNIKEIETLLNPDIKIKSDVNEILSEYVPNLIVIDCGEKSKGNVQFSQALEIILIALFNTKYNK